jgi:tRNA/tmRNA/rRNA uracil-C5-methylase (TrmA/RlmC/RlmD family)
VRERLELKLDGIAHGGEALGWMQGRVIFVPFAIPGERVRVELVEEKPRWCRARLVEVLEPSPDRVNPPCPYFGPEKCGGCQWQHIAYERQASLKQEILADQLRRLGHIADPPVADVIALAGPASPDAATTGDDILAFGYRNQAHFVVDHEGRLGLRGLLATDVIPVERCLLLHERLDDLYGALDVLWPSLTGVSLRTGVSTGQSLVILESSGDEQPELEIDMPAACAVRTRRGIVPLIGEPWVEEQVAGHLFRVSAESFFHANTTGADALVEVVASYLEPRPTDCLLDAYCGVGLFGVGLAGLVGQLIGIDSSRSACEDFAHNAGARDGVALHEGALSDVLPILREQGQPVDLVVMDPPATGAGVEVVGQLAALSPRRIVYVSGDPAMLARDSVHFESAGYDLVEAQPVDMFPQTCQVETVALWEPTK